MTFGVVAFSIIVQGLTVKPLLRLLGIELEREEDYDLAKARSSAYATTHRELELMLRDQLISPAVHEKLNAELNTRIQEAQAAIVTMQEENQNIVNEEMRLARIRLIAVEKSAFQRSANQGLISVHVAERLLKEADQRLDEEIRKGERDAVEARSEQSEERP